MSSYAWNRKEAARKARLSVKKDKQAGRSVDRAKTIQTAVRDVRNKNKGSSNKSSKSSSNNRDLRNAKLSAIRSGDRQGVRDIVNLKGALKRGSYGTMQTIIDRVNNKQFSRPGGMSTNAPTKAALNFTRPTVQLGNRTIQPPTPSMQNITNIPQKPQGILDRVKGMIGGATSSLKGTMQAEQAKPFRQRIFEGVKRSIDPTGMGKAVFQGVARSGAKAVSTFAEPFLGKENVTYRPEGLAKTILGEKRIKPLTTIAGEQMQKAQPYGKLAQGGAALLPVALVASDIIPSFGAKNLAKEAVEALTPRAAMRVAKKMGVEASDDVLKRIINIKNTDEATDLINSFKKSPLIEGKGNYLYHGTGETSLENISKEGLKPGRHTGNISLSPNESYAKNWSRGGITPQGKTDGVMLRVNQDLLNTKILPSRSGVKADQLNELISKETIPPEAIEVYKNGKWQPLQEGGVKVKPKVSGMKGNEWVAGADAKLEAFYKQGEKPKGFQNRIVKTGKLAEKTETILSQKPGYTPITNKATEERALNRVVSNPDAAERYVLDATKSEIKRDGAEHTVTAMHLIREYDAAGQTEKAVHIAEQLDLKLRDAGREIQAAKLWENLSPEGVLLSAKRSIRKANENKFVWQKDLNLDDDFAKKLSELAKQRMSITDPAVRADLSTQIAELLSSLNRPGTLEKVSMGQTISQLLNVKTIGTRNPLGNEIVYRFDRLTDIFINTPIDWAKSKITGADRVITFRSAKKGEFWKNWITGGKAGWKGVNPAGIGSQYDITPGLKFQSKWNPMHWLEKSLGATIKSFDYAAYMRGKNQTVGQLARLRAINEGLKGKELTEAAKKYASEVDVNILETADKYGKWITFQDDNFLSKGLGGIKRGLNFGQKFGLGDVVAKYTKTLGALAARSLEFSPAGFLKSAYLISEPLLRGRAVNSREVQQSIGRAIAGSVGLTGLGYFLADKGILTGKVDKDADVRAAQKKQGMGGYQINGSALKRWVFSRFKESEAEFQEGDVLFTYDWAQPLSMSVALGANLAQEKKTEGKIGKYGVLTSTVNALETGVETTIEQPLARGIKRLFGPTEGMVGGVLDAIKGAPASFAPTIGNQINQLLDNNNKETYDPNFLKEMKNLVIARIPFLSRSLPDKVGTDGQPIERYQNGTNSIVNVMINPAFKTQFESSPESKMVLDLYKDTGETSQFPRTVKKTVQDENGNTINLTPEQYTEMQKYVGEKTKEQFTKLAESKEFQEMNDIDKVNKLTSLLTAIGADAKRDVLGIGKGSGTADDAFMKYTQEMKSLNDQDFKKKMTALKGGTPEDQAMADTIMKYKRDDIAKEIGLDFKKKWSDLEQQDKANVLEEHIKWLGDKERVEFFKSMLDKDFLTDPQIKEIAKRGVLKPDDILKSDVGSGVKSMVLYETLKSETGDFFKGAEDRQGVLDELNEKTEERLKDAITKLDMSPREKQSQFDSIVQGLKDYRVDDRAITENLAKEDERWSQMNVNDRAGVLVKHFTGMDKAQAEERFAEMEEKGLITESVKEEFIYQWKKAKDENAKEISMAEGKKQSLYDEAKVLVQRKINGEQITPEEEQKIQTAMATKPENIEAPGTVALASSINIGEGTLADRNNNPGNLRYAGQEGASQGEGGFARFDSPEAGYEALKSQIKLDASRGMTVSEFVSKYAPPTENDTGTYIRQFNASVGSDSGTKLSSLDTERVAEFMALKESSTRLGEKIAQNPPTLNQPQTSLLRSVASGKTTEEQATQKVLDEFNKVNTDPKAQEAAQQVAVVPPKVKYSNIGYIPPEYFDATSRIYGLIASLQLLQSRWSGTAPNQII